jgi:hypothetical protein
MSPLVVVCYGVTAVAFVDALRRSPSEWLEADRNKAFWLVMLVFLNVLGALAYVLFVVTRFSGSRATGEDFLKRSSDRSVGEQGGWIK